MRIDLNGSAASQIASERAKTESATAKQQSSSAKVNDRATLSFDSVAVSALASKAMQTPEIRQAKVSSLQHAISTGQYKIDPDKIASAMLKENE